jgi:hypothetical protein
MLVKLHRMMINKNFKVNLKNIASYREIECLEET